MFCKFWKKRPTAIFASPFGSYRICGEASRILNEGNQIKPSDARELRRALSGIDCILYEYGLSLRDLSFK